MDQIHCLTFLHLCKICHIKELLNILHFMGNHISPICYESCLIMRPKWLREVAFLVTKREDLSVFGANPLYVLYDFKPKLLRVS